MCILIEKILIKKFVEERRKECISAIQDKIEKENFEKTMEWVEDYIGKKEYGEKGLIIFASHINNFFEGYRISIPVKTPWW